MKALFELLYSVLIGVAVALFIGFSIWAAYPGPKMPEFPMIEYSNNGEMSDADKQKQKDFDNQFKDFQVKDREYGQKVAIAATVAALLFFAGGLWRLKRNEVLRDGLAFGGIFTALYALMRASTSMYAQRGNRLVVFGAVTALLVMAIVLVTIKFNEPKPKKSK